MSSQHVDAGGDEAVYRSEDGGDAAGAAGTAMDQSPRAALAAAPGLPAPDVASDAGEDETADALGADSFQLRLYDPADVDRAIQAITGADNGDEYVGPVDERPMNEAELSTEERLRLRRLRALAADRRGPWRPLIRANPAMVERLARIRERAAHFAPLLDLVTRAAHLAMETDSPLGLPPILLLGEPGIGKTWIMKQVAAAIGSDVTVLPMNITDAFRIRGLNTAWRGARPGRIADALLASGTGSPVILLDELEKTPRLDRHDQPFDVWHSLLERENAAGTTDDYWELPFCCDRILWIASANSPDPLPPSILDRLLMLPILAPDAGQLDTIITSLYASIRDRLGAGLAEELAPAVRAALARHSPRRVGRILELALGYAATDGRMALSAADVARAAGMMDGAASRGSFRHPVGFTP